MTIFSTAFHRLFSASPKPELRKELAALQEVYRLLKHDFTLLERNMEDHSEKTRRNLERYRARDQARKDGRFGTEVPAGTDNSDSLAPNPTHEQITSYGRSKGLIR